MSKTIPAALQTHLEQDLTTLATCLKMTRRTAQNAPIGWNPSDVYDPGGNFSFSKFNLADNARLQVTTGAGFHNVRTSRDVRGLRYWEITVKTAQFPDDDVFLGIIGGHDDITGDLRSTPSNALIFSLGTTLHKDGAFDRADLALSNTPEITYRFAYNSKTRKFWIGDSSGWALGGDPAAGTGEVGTMSGSNDNIRIVYGDDDVTQSNNVDVRLNSGGEDFTYTMPTGFQAYGDIPYELFFTDHDKDIVFGDDTYESALGFGPSNVQTKADLSVDNLDVQGLLDAAKISEGDIAAGLYDFASFELFQLNFESPSDGRIKLRKGFLGEITQRNGAFVAEVRGLAQKLQQTVGGAYTALCDVDLGSAKCGVRLDPPYWTASTAVTATSSGDAGVGTIVKPLGFNGRHFRCTTAGTTGGTEPSWNTTIGGTTNDGTGVWTAVDARTYDIEVTAVTNRRQFKAAVPAGGAPAAYFDNGLTTWLSGNNDGFQMEVKEFTLDGGNDPDFVLVQNLPYDIQVGDILTVTAGCTKRNQADCKTKFDNIENFRGFPFIPGADKSLRFGGQ